MINVWCFALAWKILYKKKMQEKKILTITKQVELGSRYAIHLEVSPAEWLKWNMSNIEWKCDSKVNFRCSCDFMENTFYCIMLVLLFWLEQKFGKSYSGLWWQLGFSVAFKCAPVDVVVKKPTLPRINAEQAVNGLEIEQLLLIKIVKIEEVIGKTKVT